jgi:hypothetical protein
VARWGWCLLGVFLVAADLHAQDAARFEAGGHFVVSTIRELDVNDVGVSGRIAWKPTSMLGVEAELGLFPNDVPDRRAVSSSRVEFAAGVTAGPALGAVRPFARFRTGVLRFAEAPAPVACILIFPPPLSCQLAGGHSALMLDAGGGVEIGVGGRSFLRIDIGDRLVRYPGPSFGRDREIHDDDFFGHDLRVAVGSGWRF